MPTQIPDRYGSFAAKLTGPGTAADDSIVTIGVHRNAVAGGPDATWDQVFNQYREGFRDFFTALLHVGWTFVGADLTYREGGVLQGLTATEFVQGSISSPAPAFTSLVLQKRTNLIGRQFRGRMSVPGVIGTANVQPDGTLSNATIAAYAPTVLALFNKLEWDSSQLINPPLLATPVILHQAAITPTRVTSLLISSSVGINKTRYR